MRPPNLRGLRVTHVVCTDAFAGVERYVTTLASEEARRGLDVAVVGGERERMASVLADSSVDWAPGATPLRALRPLLRDRADIIHAHMTAAEATGLLIATVRPVRLVVTRHFARRRGSSIGPRALGRIITPRLDSQIAISHHVAEHVEGASTVIYPGTPSADAPPPERRERVVLVLQRLEREKRTELAIRIWAASGLAASGWSMRVVGDGSCRPRLEALSRSLGVNSSCHFLGQQADVARHLGRAGILLAPSDGDAYGLSVVEAMAAGLPVVAAAAGGHLETVGSVPDAALYRPDDLTRAAELLRTLADSAEDRAAYGARLQARQRDEFTVETQVDAVLDVYEGLLR